MTGRNGGQQEQWLLSDSLVYLPRRDVRILPDTADSIFCDNDVSPAGGGGDEEEEEEGEGIAESSRHPSR